MREENPMSVGRNLFETRSWTRYRRATEDLQEKSGYVASRIDVYAIRLRAQFR